MIKRSITIIVTEISTPFLEPIDVLLLRPIHSPKFRKVFELEKKIELDENEELTDSDIVYAVREVMTEARRLKNNDQNADKN